MPGEINIVKIYYGNDTAVVQSWSFAYKLATAPESAYVTIGTSTVQTDGDLDTPLSVTGLPSETLYHVRATNLSCSPGETYTQQYTTE